MVKKKIYLPLAILLLLVPFVVVEKTGLDLTSAISKFSLPLAADKKSVSKISEKTTVPVLMYHYIRKGIDSASDPVGFGLSVTPQDFELQLKYLTKNNYLGITPDELYDLLKTRVDPPEKYVLFTFDDGYRDFYTTAYPLLKKYNFKATVFVISGFVSEPDGRYLSWEQIKELDRSGLVTIAAHTDHHKDLVSYHDPRKEIIDNKKTLEKFLGHAVSAFAYPSGQYNDHIISLVREAGFKTAFTTKFGISHTFDRRLELARVRISGGLSMEKFIERLEGKLSTN